MNDHDKPWDQHGSSIAQQRQSFQKYVYNQILRRCEDPKKLQFSSVFESAFDTFFSRLPSNQGAQVCLDDLFSFTSSSSLSISSIIDYLLNPPFAATLADLGKIPNNPYILIFDPCVIQQEILDGRIAPDWNLKSSDASSEYNNKIDMMSINMDSIFQQGGFQESKSFIKCAECKTSEFLIILTVQTRRSDEGSKYIYNCGKCKKENVKVYQQNF